MQRLGGANWGVLFSSESMEWETPPALFAALDAEFGFELDVCARPENAKCDRFYSPEDDGLAQEWSGACWMNPPYGRQIGAWMEKAFQESRKPGTVVVCLVHARTDTGWFHEWGMKARAIRVMRGRPWFRQNGVWHSAKHVPFPAADLRRGE